MLRRLGAALAVAIVAVLVGTAAVVPAAASVETVAIRDYAFSPETLPVVAGTTVTWTNFDIAPHTVTGVSGPVPLSSPQLQRGQSWSYTFEQAGTYRYYCAVHPAMIGSVVVSAARTAAVASPVAAGARAPAASTGPAPSATAATPAPAVVPRSSRDAPVAAPVATTPAEEARPFLVLAAIAVAVAGLATLAVRARPH